MNERIRELADKSGFGPAWYDPTIPTSDIDRRWIDQSRLKEFAELIVRECAEKAYAGIGPDSLDAYDRGWQNGRNSASQVIKEHFGVE